MPFTKGGVNLNLGSNVHVKEGYVNVDLEPWPGVNVVCDLEKPWPFESDSVDYIMAEDIFEHLHSPTHSMNEAWRVLKPGGELYLRIPSTDGRGAFQDPTHVSFWNMNSLYYYSVDHPDYHFLYPSLIHCSFSIQAEHTAPNLLKVIWVNAICKKVPHVKPVVSEGAS